MTEPGPPQRGRYARQVDALGAEGREKLRDAAVLVVGAGGLGSPVVQYLGAAGVGRLGVADDDVVERSNLQRQVVHGEGDVGRPKVASAREFVADRNPDVDVRTHEVRVDPDNVAGLVEGYDVVVDASDNLPTRYLLSDACTLAGLPLSQGAVSRMSGQVTTFPGRGPCYRCLFPEAPPEGTVPDCATAGVLGVLPGTVGTLQATEAVKLLAGIGEPLDGRVLALDAAGATVDEVAVRQNPDCPVCGDDPSVDSVREVDYAGTCALEG